MDQFTFNLGGGVGPGGGGYVTTLTLICPMVGLTYRTYIFYILAEVEC